MEYFVGFVVGVGVCLAVRAILLEWMPGGDCYEEHPVSRPVERDWVQTRNFLYYDGTVMPSVKEETNEQ